MSEVSQSQGVSAGEQGKAPPWKPLPAIERRVAAAIVEKAKTTPNAYPMSLNAIRVACNQTSNRDPVMELDEDQVQAALDELRESGVVLEVHGSGRVPKYRHMLYEWLGVNKLEMAVMVELLLRGAQTEGELRSRAARMEVIADLTTLRSVLEGLKARGLVIPLTPEGRGHMITHGLYEPRELERLRAQYGHGSGSHASGGAASAGAFRTSPGPTTSNAETDSPSAEHVPRPTSSPGSTPDNSATVKRLELAIEQLQIAQRALVAEVQELRTEVTEIRDQYEQRIASLERFREDVGG